MSDEAEAHKTRILIPEPPPLRRAAAAAERFVIRTLRILGGVALVRIGIWLFEVAVENLQEPFASLSPLALLGGIVAGLGGLLLLVAAFGTAFGEKGESRIEMAWRRSYLESPDIKRSRLGYD